MAMVGPMAKMVEDAGFESCWAAETTNTAFVTASIAIQATSKIKVGTAIALAFPRSPTITAMTAGTSTSCPAAASSSGSAPR